VAAVCFLLFFLYFAGSRDEKERKEEARGCDEARTTTATQYVASCEGICVLVTCGNFQL